MFVDAIRIASQGMFPIFRYDEIDADRYLINAVGTGFFVNADGYFVSVAHVFDDPSSRTDFRFLGFVPDHVQNPPIRIQEVVRDNQHDIFVGKVNLQTPHYLTLSKNIPPIGRTLCIAGYPLPVIKPNDQGGVDLSGVRRYFQPSFLVDGATLSIDNGHGVSRTHDGFLIRDFGLFGMSGGPVFDIKGTILGVQASVTAPRESISGQRKIVVENAVAIKTPLITELLKANNIQFAFAD